MDLIESHSEELKLIRKPMDRFWVAAFVLLLILMPWFVKEHVVYTATLICIYGIGILGQNLLIGYAGQLSLGQAGFLLGCVRDGRAISAHGIGDAAAEVWGPNDRVGEGEPEDADDVEEAIDHPSDAGGLRVVVSELHNVDQRRAEDDSQKDEHGRNSLSVIRAPEFEIGNPKPVD